MSEKDYAELLRALCSEYFKEQISFGEYRERRKVVLDEMDAEFNDRHEDEASSPKRDASFIKKAAELFGFKNSDDQEGKVEQ